MNGHDNVFEIDRAYTCKSLQINHTMIKSVNAAFSNTPVFMELNFIADNNYKTYSNRV